MNLYAMGNIVLNAEFQSSTSSNFGTSVLTISLSRPLGACTISTQTGQHGSLSERSVLTTTLVPFESFNQLFNVHTYIKTILNYIFIYIYIYIYTHRLGSSTKQHVACISSFHSNLCRWVSKKKK